MTEQANDAPTQYRIGAVSRMTGISPDALRIWERRYTAVSPQRSPGGGRLYSSQDVARLRLMKRLVDAGDAIGAVANLDLDTLQGRTVEAQRLPSAPPRCYDDEVLSQLAALSSTVKCECPKHLAELIASLSGFERYGAECESRSPRDAALHAYLHATASKARSVCIC